MKQRIPNDETRLARIFDRLFGFPSVRVRATVRIPVLVGKVG